MQESIFTNYDQLPLFLNANSVAQVLGVSISSAYELMHERGVSAMGGAPSSPGAIRALRLNIARILTVQKEEEKI